MPVERTATGPIALLKTNVPVLAELKTRTRVLIITPDSIGEKMAGPAIRALEITKRLHQIADVHLVSINQSNLRHPNFPISFANTTKLKKLVAWANVVIFQGSVLAGNTWMLNEDIRLVADIYDPIHLEVLEQNRYLPFADRISTSEHVTSILNHQIQHADLLLCASEKQRDFWLGHLASLGRINPWNYDSDSSLRRLISVVPFGISDEQPKQKTHGIKGRVPGISQSDKVILWGGGIYNWFDPLTLIRAVQILHQKHPELRLYFLGAKHPNPDVPEMEIAAKTYTLAAELGILNKVVFFNDSWVPYRERADFLLDADLGVSTHFDHLETAFSFRTRMLDYIWAGLPIVSTEGDTFAELIERHDLGRVVPPKDITALATAIELCLYDPITRAKIEQNVARFASRMRWSTVLSPLVDYCLDPKPATDFQKPSMLTASQPELLLEQDRLNAVIKQLTSSTSWRITKPLRRGKDFILRFINKDFSFPDESGFHK